MRQADKKRIALQLAVLAVAALVLAALFVLWGLNANNFDYNFPRRLKKIAAIALCGVAVAQSSLVFQTITNNRILSPSVMGLDSLYQFLQTIVVYFFGTRSIAMISKFGDFALSTLLMVGFSLVLFRLVFRRSGSNLYVLVLVGMVFGSFFGSLSSFMQAMIDPNEFLIVQGKMFASFNNVNTALLGVSAVVILLAGGYIWLTSHKLDVLALGRANAISLGVHYDTSVLAYLVLVAVLVSVSTALVGSVTFLGVMVTNVARQMFGTYKHSVLSVGAALLSVVALIGGQMLVERVFAFNTTVSVIVNFVGGIYFLFLLLKERKV